MGIVYEAFADRLAQRFAALSDLIEGYVLAERISAGDTFCSYHFEIDAPTLRGLGALFQADTLLWADFRRAVQDHRKFMHWTMLVEHVYEVGNLEGKLRLLEQGVSCPSTGDRRRLAAHLNCLDGEIGLCRELADRRGLAARIRRAAGFPLLDGLNLRGLTYVLGEHADLWHDFQALVGCANETVCGRQPLNDDQP
jgi:hypothetical protein